VTLIKNSCIPQAIIFVGVVLSILFLPQQLQFVRAQNELVYDNKLLGLKIQYPTNWSVNEENIDSNGTGYVEFLPPDRQSSIRIGSTYEEFSPESIAKITIQEIAKTFEDFRLIDEGPLTINGRHAYDVFLEYRHPSKGTVKNEYIFIEANNNGLYSFALQGAISLGEYIQMATVLLHMANSAEFVGFGQGNLDNIIITLERGLCFGTCPYYSLNIFENGTVVYNGYKFVNVTGQQISKISEEEIGELVREFYNINYFSLKDNYTEIVSTDQPAVTTSININGIYKEVIDNQGAIAPQGLRLLENKIDEVTNSSKWTKPYELPRGKPFYEILIE
jgi:hypothetical protein